MGEAVFTNEYRVNFVSGQITNGTPDAGFVACGDFTEYCMEVTLDQLAEILYRVKDAWFVSGSIAGENSDLPWEFSEGTEFKPSVGSQRAGSIGAYNDPSYYDFKFFGSAWIRGYTAGIFDMPKGVNSSCFGNTYSGTLYSYNPWVGGYYNPTEGFGPNGFDLGNFGYEAPIRKYIETDLGISGQIISNGFKDLLPNERCMWQIPVEETRPWTACAFDHRVSSVIEGEIPG